MLLNVFLGPLEKALSENQCGIEDEWMRTYQAIASNTMNLISTIGTYPYIYECIHTSVNPRNELKTCVSHMFKLKRQIALYQTYLFCIKSIHEVDCQATHPVTSIKIRVNRTN